MKNKKIIIVVVISIVALCVIFGIIMNLNNDESKKDITEISLSETINIKDKTIKSKSSSKDVEIILPEFQNLDDGYEKYINTKIYNEINDSTVYNEAILGLEEEDIGMFTYEVSYDRYNCGDYVSLVVNQYIHLGDGRPRVQKKCFVINAKENATATLVDVIENKANYKDSILAEINNQAKEKDIELVGGNGLSELSSTQAFYIKDGKLVIYFESSEIAPTAVGELEFVMPYEMINNKFNTKK